MEANGGLVEDVGHALGIAMLTSFQLRAEERGTDLLAKPGRVQRQQDPGQGALGRGEEQKDAEAEDRHTEGWGICADKLTNQTNHLIEFSDGEIEVLPMPTRSHQVILLLLYELFKAMVNPLGGIVLVAPLRVQVGPGKFREPDVLMLLQADDPRNQDAFWLGADIVVEIVSPDRPERDTEEKPRDYAD